MPDEVVSIEPLIDVDPPAGEVKTEPPAAAADEQKAETPEQQEVKKESRRQRKLTRERDARIAAETENRLLKEQLAAREAKPAAVEGEPKREDFEDYEGYQRAIARYEAKQVAREELKTHREASQGDQAKSKQAEAQQAIAKAWTEREAAFSKSAPDYEETVTAYADEDLGQLSDGARRLIVDSELGPQVLHHLATHADVHERIAKLSPLRQVVELGKLEDSLQAKEEKDEPKVEGKKISTAPPPIKTASGGKSASQGYRENMSDTEYKEWRKSQGAAWAR